MLHRKNVIKGASDNAHMCARMKGADNEKNSIVKHAANKLRSAQIKAANPKRATLAPKKSIQIKRAA